jgi:prepilin-type N-terminal cleavage/methylation domain-containing protein
VRSGFTLIEMLAVVAIFALMAAFIGPNIGFVSRRALGHEADRLAAHLELARQRSVATAIPHRVYFDLDGHAYRLESLRSEGEEGGKAEAPPEPTDLLSGAPLPLSAPREQERKYQPLPGMLGRFNRLDEDVSFAGLETPESWIEAGDAFVAFERDGTTTYTIVVLDTEDGEALELEILPLADAVRVRDAQN